MSSPLVDIILSQTRKGRGRGGLFGGGGGAEDPFTRIANAIAMIPAAAQAKKSQEAEDRHLERTRELEIQGKELGLKTGRAGLERADRTESRAEAEFQSSQGERERELEKTTRSDAVTEALPEARGAISEVFRGREHASPASRELMQKSLGRFPGLSKELLDIESGETAQMNAEANRTRANRPPGAGSRPAMRVVRDEFGNQYAFDPTPNLDGSLNPASPIPLEGGGQARASGLGVGEIDELTSFDSAIVAGRGLMDVWSKFQESSVTSPTEYEANLERFMASARAAAVNIGRALGEQRMTDEDREVYTAALTPSRFRILLGESGLGPKKVVESINRMTSQIRQLRDVKARGVASLRGLDPEAVLERAQAGDSGEDEESAWEEYQRSRGQR